MRLPWTITAPNSREVDEHFDRFAIALSTGLSRRAALRCGLGLTGAAVASLLPLRFVSALADSGDNRAAAQLCQQVPPGLARGMCMSAFAQNPELLTQCSTCGGAICIRS